MIDFRRKIGSNQMMMKNIKKNKKLNGLMVDDVEVNKLNKIMGMN